jgi:hypothetical protein
VTSTAAAGESRRVTALPSPPHKVGRSHVPMNGEELASWR